MKNKILIKAIIYFAIVIGICQFLNFTFPAPDIVTEREWVKNLMSQKDSLRSLTFGRSHGVALHYDHWDVKGQNLSLGGEDIASIKYSLEYFAPQMKNLKEVLICISYSSLYFDNEALSNGNLNDARKALYASIPSYKLVSPKDYNNMVFGKMFAFMHADYGFGAIKNIVIGKKEFEEDPITKAAPFDSVKIIKSAPVQAHNHSQDKTLALEYNPNIRTQYVSDLKDIITFLKARNIKCILFTPPYYKDYTNLYPQADIEETEHFMEEICNETGAAYYNFSRYEPMANNIRLYANADHVNRAGGDEFTILFNKILRNKTLNINDYSGLKIINLKADKLSKN
ncbi:hypothetical protein ACCC92_10030 [Mucilaginibacter sp. Mucisp84]|uniref:hypothetical protein n=1 Tax=Mucilaginibacter sp. Mucisp84 TaxID=3243058 RepID=UPI0039A5E4A1